MNPDGSRAYSGWIGGVLGVLEKQMRTLMISIKSGIRNSVHSGVVQQRAVATVKECENSTSKIPTYGFPVCFAIDT